MADKELRIVIKAVDEATKTIDTIKKSIEGIGKVKGVDKLAEGLAKINPKAAAAIAVIAKVGGAFNKLYQASKKSFIEGISKIGSACKVALSGVVALGKGFLNIVQNVTNQDLSFSGLTKTAIDFEQSLSTLSAITEQGSDGLKKFTDKALELGSTTCYTPYEIAEGMNEMAQQGMSATEILKNIPDVTNLAIAGMLDMEQASGLVAGAMNIWKRQNLTATDATDLFSKTALISGATVEDFGQTLKYAGATAAKQKIPMKQVAAVTSIMGNSFVKGSQAGTALRRIITNMGSPTDKLANYLHKMNLESAQQKILSGDLTGGLADMADKYNTLNDAEKANFATKIAGVYASTAFTTVMESGRKGIEEYASAMEKASGSTEQLVEAQKNTVKYQMVAFASKLQTGAYLVYKAIQTPMMEAMKFLNDKVIQECLNGNFTQAFKNVENASAGFGQKLSNAIQQAVSGLSKFVNTNGGIFDSMLQTGTNIVQGICNGISKSYESGNLTAAISGFIGKICDWITTNAPAIETAGRQIIDAIMQGIENNKDKIRTAMDSLCGIIETWVQGSASLDSAMGTFGNVMMESFITQIGIKAKAKAGEFMSAIASIFTPSETPNMNKGITGLVNWIYEKFTGESQEPSKQTGGKMASGVADGFDSNKELITSKGSEVGTATADAIQKGLESMNTSQLDALAKAIKEVGTVTSNTAQGMAQSFGQIRNSARDSFMGMTNIVRNQMVNATNIVRNQSVNWSNIMRNQAQNARNALTSSFISMAAVARTQMVNISNIVRNQAVSWSNVIRNQAQNARNSLTRSFMSMAAVARTQMAKVLSVVQSYMSQIQAATNKELSIKVHAEKTITTTNVTKNVSLPAPTPIALASTMANTMAYAAAPASPTSSSTIGGHASAYGKSSSSDNNYTFSIPLYLDGREVAKATAKYNQAELSKLNKRNSRKRGE